MATTQSDEIRRFVTERFRNSRAFRVADVTRESLGRFESSIVSAALRKWEVDAMECFGFWLVDVTDEHSKSDSTKPHKRYRLDAAEESPSSVVPLGGASGLAAAGAWSEMGKSKNGDIVLKSPDGLLYKATRI